MSRGDVALRALEREAQGGDPAAEVRLLVARLRAGTLTQERLELAAWCGSDAARALVPCHDEPSAYVVAIEGDSRLLVPTPLSAWLRGLSRWADVGPVPGWVLVRAAVAAARVALPKARRGVSGPGGQSMSATAAREQARAAVRAAHRAITAAEAWLDDPSEERRLACGRMVMSWAAASRPDDWWSQPVMLIDWGAAAHPGRLEACCRSAADVVDEAPVRTAICSALTSWALETPA